MSLKAKKLSVIKFTKDFLLASRLLQLFQPLNKGFAFLYNFNLLTSWAHQHKKDKLLLNDFYKPIRNYQNRTKSYIAVSENYRLNEIPVCYLEFGVASGASFKWWVNNCANPSSVFFGFDTFEGLPEKWGFYAKGDFLQTALPEINDNRALFIKGIFQDTLTGFLQEYGPSLKDKKKVIHMDADLFTATLFALSQLYPFLQKGDIIMFDEFSVYNHEFMAYRLFTECFYIKLKLISMQNNFYHTVFEVE